jgi:hypothetical protein
VKDGLEDHLWDHHGFALARHPDYRVREDHSAFEWAALSLLIFVCLGALGFLPTGSFHLCADKGRYRAYIRTISFTADHVGDVVWCIAIKENQRNANIGVLEPFISAIECLINADFIGFLSGNIVSVSDSQCPTSRVFGWQRFHPAVEVKRVRNRGRDPSIR